MIYLSRYSSNPSYNGNSTVEIGPNWLQRAYGTETRGSYPMSTTLAALNLPPSDWTYSLTGGGVPISRFRRK